jgi:septal ring factor EnvC (AmiA/AmiB activator)
MKAPEMKTPSALKWMAENRTRISHRLNVSAKARMLLVGHIEMQTEELARTRALLDSTVAREKRLTQDLASLDGSLKIYDDAIDPAAIEPVNGWKGRYGKRGALQEFLAYGVRYDLSNALCLPATKVAATH